MDEMMSRLHQQGITRQQMEERLRNIPFDQGMLKSLQLIHERGADTILVSDANLFFIQCILKHHGLDAVFAAERIFTNGAMWDDKGRLCVSTFQPKDTPHNCQRCPLNMCKGGIVQRYLQLCGPYDRIVYVGDGSGGFCPVLSLRTCDFVLARRDFPLHNLCAYNPSVQATVRPWRDGAEAYRVFQELLS